MTRSRDVADTQDNLGGPVPPFVAGKNFIINGGFGVWQRGTSSAVTSSSLSFLLADRWKVYRAATGSTVSRQVTGDTTNLPFIQYCQRIARDSGNAATNVIATWQNFESVNSIPLAGKTVVLSFYARAGANYSAASSALSVQLLTGTGTDQDAATGYTGAATPINATATLTTTWQRFTYSATIASTVTELAPYFTFTPVGTAGANDYFEITGVQLEAASTASLYAPNGATYQAELAACQRYYYQIGGDSLNQRLALGSWTTTTNFSVGVPLPVSMRVTPSSVSYGTLICYDGVNYPTISAVALDGASKNMGQVAVTTSSATQFRPAWLMTNGSLSGFLAYNAEL